MPLILADALHAVLVCGLSVASAALTPPPEGHAITFCRLECWPLMQGGAMVVGNLEFKIAGDEGRLWTRGALPKGTSRKCAELAFRACMAFCGISYAYGETSYGSISKALAEAKCVHGILF